MFLSAMLATVLATLFIALVGATAKCPTRPVQDTIILRNPSNCSTFYICANGIPYLMSCSHGLHFNSELRVCDWPEHANCIEFHPTSTTSQPTEASSESSEESSEESTDVPPDPSETSPEPTESSPEPSETSPKSTETTSPEPTETSPEPSESSPDAQS